AARHRDPPRGIPHPGMGQRLRDTHGERRLRCHRPRGLLNRLRGSTEMALDQAAIPTPEERAAAHLATEEMASRDARRPTFIGAALCFFWLVVGLYIFAWSMHVTDHKTGMIFFWAGLLVGNTGIVLSSYWVVRKMTARGDFGAQG